MTKIQMFQTKVLKYEFQICFGFSANGGSALGTTIFGFRIFGLTDGFQTYSRTGNDP